MRVRLLINLYPESDPARSRELATSLERNLANSFIDEVVVLDEGFPGLAELRSPKLRIVAIDHRPTIAEFAEHFGDDVNALANSDVWFDESLRHLRVIRVGARDVLALTRYESDGTLFRHDLGDSQDAWIFRGPCVPLQRCNEPLGRVGIDSVILYRCLAAGYRLLNPSRAVKLHHEHASPERSYDPTDRLGLPYVHLRPTAVGATHLHRLTQRLLHSRQMFRVIDEWPDYIAVELEAAKRTTTDG